MSYSKAQYYFAKKAKTICSVVRLQELEQLCGVPEFQLRLMAQQPAYNCFHIPKRNGKSRLIETPQEPLSIFLKSLSSYLQPLYSLKKTPAAYGFILCFPGDPAPRSILTNAHQHLGNDFLVNIDLKDFFHQITFAHIFTLFKSDFFQLDEDAAYQLALLTTYQGRLPMGSSTSPVLSNFATIALDKALLKWAVKENCTYTRFVDDLTFSARYKLTESHIESILSILHEHRLQANPSKIKYFGSMDEKQVTGLILLKNEVAIPQLFFEDLEDDIARLKAVLELQAALSNKNNERWLVPFEQSIEGKINFVQSIYGKNSSTYQKFAKLFADVYQYEPYLESASWMDWGYENII